MSALDRQLQDLWSHMSHPAAIVTAARSDDRAGCLVGLHIQCSIDPLRALVYLSRANRTFELARWAERLAVHYPGESDVDIAELFGSESGYDTDKFARVPWTAHDGIVILDDIEHRWAGTVVDRVDLGDHEGFILEPTGFSGGMEDIPRFIDMSRLSHLRAGRERGVS